MNTLSDTDEGRARPSVWPVYVAAAVIGLITLSRMIVAVPPLVADWVSFHLDMYLLILLSICLLWLLFGMLTCWGLVRLRMWAWWCAASWTFVYAYWDMVVLWEAQHSPPPTHHPVSIGPFILPVTAPAAAAIAVIAWALATRWRLFFPPRPEGEE